MSRKRPPRVVYAGGLLWWCYLCGWLEDGRCEPPTGRWQMADLLSPWATTTVCGRPSCRNWPLYLAVALDDVELAAA